MDRMPATLQLMLPALIFSATVGILLGIFSARKPYSLADNTISVFSSFGYCVPAFLLGQMLMASSPSSLASSLRKASKPSALI